MNSAIKNSQQTTTTTSIALPQFTVREIFTALLDLGDERDISAQELEECLIDAQDLAKLAKTGTGQNSYVQGLILRHAMAKLKRAMPLGAA